MAVIDSFAGPSYVSQSPITDCEECINWFPEITESQGGKNRYALYPTPGLTVFGTTSVSPGRGEFYQDGRMFAVVGYQFGEMSSAGVFTAKGAVDNDGAPATICSSGDGGNELFITSGGNGYIFDLLTDVFSQVAGLNATMGGFIDGFFIALDTINSRVRISNYFDGLTWDVTQYRVRSLASDKWTAMIVTQTTIWLFGTRTYEVWQNTGSFPFPFNPIPGYFFAQGCGAQFSLASLGDAPAWLTMNEQGEGQVMLAQQYSPIRISTHAVEWSIQGFRKAGVSLSDAIGFAYQEDGHDFYCLTFPSIDDTWVYDLSTKMWHKRRSWANTSAEPAHWEAWRPLFHVYAFNKHIVQDRALGTFYEMGTHLYSDVGGSPIRRVRVPPILYNEKKRVYISRLELDMQVGMGLSSGQGSDPTVMLRISDDGGFTWGNEMHASAGAIGKYGTSVYWNKLGQSDNWVPEITVSDPVPWRLTNAYVTVRDVKQRKR